MTPTDRGLYLDGVGIALAGRQLLEVTRRVDPGEVLTVMGPSGSGKSSLLAYIGGFLDPAFKARGRVIADGLELTSLPAEDRHAGILFQDPLLFPHMSVSGNLLFAIPPAIKGKQKRDELAREALAGVGLSDFDDRDPDTLSGGQKARIALARVLLSQPRTLLLDEPFSKLDQDRRDQMRQLVFSKARELGLPAILVTHDQADADAAGGPVIRIGEDNTQ